MPRSPSASVGLIPETLRVVCKEPREYCKWVDGVKHKALVSPAYFQDIKTDPAKALEWAHEWKRPDGHITPYRPAHWNGKKMVLEPGVVELKGTVAEEPNKPRTCLRFWCIDERAEGGRAYNVIDKDGRIFDMREDVVEEAIFNGEFNNGVFTGKYIFGVSHTQVRLIRLDSELHKKLAEAGRRKTLVKIKNKDLEVGGVYQMRNGEVYVYLGRKPGKAKSMYEIGQVEAGMKFVRLFWRWGEERHADYQKAFDEKMNKAGRNSRTIEWRNSQSMVEKVGTVDTRGHEV
jgi:hypothetical protein